MPSKVAVKPAAKAVTVAKLPVAKAPPVKTPIGRQPGAFETKVLTALKRHGGAAVSFGRSPEHIKSAFKRCLASGWASGTLDSASLTPEGDRVLTRLGQEIRAFPAPTLRNRLNDALFRNQNGKPAAPAAAAPAEAAEEEVEDDEDETIPENEDEEEVESEIEQAA
jgi:hypothetical protein